MLALHTPRTFRSRGMATSSGNASYEMQPSVKAIFIAASHGQCESMTYTVGHEAPEDDTLQALAGCMMHHHS